MSARSRLTADARRSLALLAGGDLPAGEAADARALAADCPDCGAHLAAVRRGLSALADCPAEAGDSGLWPAVRDALPAVAIAADPPRASLARRFAAPATALTAAAVLVGAFAVGPGLLGGADAAALPVRGVNAQRVDLPEGTRLVRDVAGRPYYLLPDGRTVPAAL